MIFVYLILYLALDTYCKSKGWDDKTKHKQEDEAYGLAIAICDEDSLSKQHHIKE